MVAMGVGVLIGALAGLYFRVFILFFLAITALLGTSIIDVGNGLPLRATLFHMVYIWGGLQFAYLGSSFLASRSQRESRSTDPEKVPNNIYATEQNALLEASPWRSWGNAANDVGARIQCADDLMHIDAP